MLNKIDCKNIKKCYKSSVTCASIQWSELGVKNPIEARTGLYNYYKIMVL